MIALLLAAALAARAADPVLHDGDPVAALARAAADTGRPPGELTATTLTALLRGRPTVLQGGGSVEVCARVPASATSFAEALTRAEGAMAFLEYDAALKELDEAASLLGCLSSPAEPVTAARMYFLRGLVFFFSGETLAARGAWVQAHRFAPDLAWDDNFPPDGQPLFDEARAAAVADEPTTLSLVPALGDESLWVDGRPVTLSEGRITLPAGAHLVQYGGSGVTTVRLTLDAGAEGTLVFPHAVRDADVAWVADAAGRTVLSDVLAAALGPDVAVLAVHADRTWAGTAGSSAWEPLDRKPLPPTGAPPIAGDRRRTWYVAGSGAALAAAGGAATLASYLTAKDAGSKASSATEVTTYRRESERYYRARKAYKISMYVGAAGLLVGAAGIAIPVSDGLRVAPNPAAPGLEIHLRR